MAANDAPPSPTRGESTPASDEVSLRELYLVLRRRLVPIVVAALLAGAGAFVVLTTWPPAFLAEASTVVARTPVSVTGESGLQFRPELDVTYETYATLAFSRGVLESVIGAVPAADLTLARARDGLVLERLAGSANQSSPLLAVAHRARAADAEIAAALATEWARATIATVQRLLNENLDSVERITTVELELARANLGQAEQSLLDFRVTNDAAADAERLAGTRIRTVALADRRLSLQRQVAAREAELASLQARGDPNETVSLADAPEVPLTVAGAVWALEARIAGARAELEMLVAQELELGAEVDALAVTVARVETTVATLDRAIVRADADVATLAAIEPTVAYVAQLAPAGARVLGEAAVPTAPEARPALLIALLTAIVVGFAGIVVALLAEAVRDPARASG